LTGFPASWKTLATKPEKLRTTLNRLATRFPCPILEVTGPEVDAWLRGLEISVVSALAKALGIEWPRNVLRHSFISYRIAKVKSADQVALEAGNSPSIIFKHYRELTTEDQADSWFGIMPKDGQWENNLTVDRKKGRTKLNGQAVK